MTEHGPPAAFAPKPAFPKQERIIGAACHRSGTYENKNAGDHETAGDGHMAPQRAKMTNGSSHSRQPLPCAGRKGAPLRADPFTRACRLANTGTFMLRWALVSRFGTAVVPAGPEAAPELCVGFFRRLGCGLSRAAHGFKRMVRSIRRGREQAGACLVGAIAWACAAAWSTGSVEAAQAIRFKVIDGKLCAKCTLSCRAKSIPANVVINLGLPTPLLVHERTARLMEVGPDAAVDLKFDDVVMPNLTGRASKLPSLDKLTSEYSTELEEIPAVAILGATAFADFSVQLEVGEGILRLLPAAQRHPPAASRPLEDATTDGSSATACSVSFEERGYGYFLAGRAPDDFALRVLFSTSGYDTIIDSNTADLAGAPGGDLDDLRLGTLNLARYVALRPEDLSGTPPPHPDVILRTNLLSHFRVTIDWVNREIRFEQTRAPQFPTEEREFFVARAKGDADAIESFLKAHPSSRLATEASTKLLALRLDEYPPNRDAIGRAQRWRAEAAPKDRRSGLMVEMADDLLSGKRDDKYALAANALKIGLEYASSALNGRTIHDLRARLGLIALRNNDAKQARRDLLSAAFGIPRDPFVNLWLGELYEQSGQLMRAWSRYAQSAISENPPPEAMTGLDRLNRNPAFRASFTMADAEQLLEGRIAEFHPAERYGEESSPTPPTRPTATTPVAPGRTVRLVELFSCVDHPQTRAPEMAFAGLREYFEPANADEIAALPASGATPATQPAASETPASAPTVALIEYHLAAPETDPLICGASVSRAAFYGIREAPVACFDGGRPNTDGGTDKDVEKIFAAYKAACLSPEGRDAAWRINGRVSLLGDEIHGAIQVRGGAGGESLRLHAMLCEKILMAPAANGLLLHRMVARAALSPDGGFPVASGEGEQVFDIRANVKQVGEALEQLIAGLEKERNVKFLMRPTYVDGGACVVVAFLQNMQSKEVLAASAFDVVPGAKGKR